MLIEDSVGAACVQLIPFALGPGSAGSRPVGVGLFCGLLALAALLESLQVDQIPHACPHHPAKEVQATFSAEHLLSRWALVCSVVIEGNLRDRLFIASKKMFRFAKTKYSCAVPR
jgi:hypothetical protein